MAHGHWPAVDPRDSWAAFDEVEGLPLRDPRKDSAIILEMAGSRWNQPLKPADGSDGHRVEPCRVGMHSHRAIVLEALRANFNEIQFAGPGHFLEKSTFLGDRFKEGNNEIAEGDLEGEAWESRAAADVQERP